MAKKIEIDPLTPVEESSVEETPVTDVVTQLENTTPSLKPTAVASGSELIAETAGAVELASPHIDPPLERIAAIPDPNAPQPLDALATTHRVPGWQAAALSRLMGWEEGKMVTDSEYRAALDLLGNRKQGGGRR